MAVFGRSMLARWIAAGSMLLLSSLSPVHAAPTRHQDLQPKTGPRSTSSTDRLVFCHFMIGITASRTSASDYDLDMQRAAALGIDAFALNIGTDEYTSEQLGYAYESAANNGMKVFISFDFNWFSTSQGSDVGTMIGQFGSKDAQLMVDGAIFASSFAGDGVDVSAIRSAAGADVFWAPNFAPGKTSSADNVDAALNWMAWPNDGNNKAPCAAGNVSVSSGDESYQSWLGDKPYIAPVSAWFSTHFGPEVSYSKNWVFPSDLLWFERWNEVLTLGAQYLEIITWNDYGESHYIGPLDSPHTDDGNSKWVNDMPHDGWMDMAKPFIAAYKAGADSIDEYVEEDQVIYWYRPTLASLDCDATDTTVGVTGAENSTGNFFEGRPNGYDTMADAVFVVTLLTEAGSVTVSSGEGSNVTFDAPAGAFATSVPLAVGSQSFQLTRNGETVLSGTSQKDVSDVCPCGIYNFNAYVGVLPDVAWGGLQSLGLEALTSGLRVQTCMPTPTIDGGILGTGIVSATGVVSATGRSGSSEIVTASEMTTTQAPTSGYVTSVPLVSVSASLSISISASLGLPSLQASTSSSASATSDTESFASTITAYKPSTTSSSSSSSFTTSISSATPSTSASSNDTSSSTCNAGTKLASVSDAYLGLCQFGCCRGYCPEDVCTCTSYGKPETAVDDGTTVGCSANGEQGLQGLCAFAVPRGYAPEGVCKSSGC